MDTKQTIEKTMYLLYLLKHECFVHLEKDEENHNLCETERKMYRNIERSLDQVIRKWEEELQTMLEIKPTIVEKEMGFTCEYCYTPIEGPMYSFNTMNELGYFYNTHLCNGCHLTRRQALTKKKVS